MTLLEECKALVREWGGYSYLDAEAIFNTLKVIVSRHEHDDWQGLWRCEKCDVIVGGSYMKHWDVTSEQVNDGTFNCALHPPCEGRLIPFERRKGERRKA